MSDPISEYGFTAVHASAKQLLLSSNNNNNNNSSGLGPSPLSPVSIPVPDTALSKRIQSYAKKHLPEATYNHSMRVYYYGQAIRRYRFAEWSFSDETYFLSCLLHDIGTTEENLHATRLSFEFYGGYLALDVLQNGDANAIAPREQAESVAEAIIRHQDLCEVGKITAVGQLVQLATIFDNTGTYSDLVHADTIAAVSREFPRLNWSSCFADTIRKENAMKPWAHTTALGEAEFPAKVLGNKLMAAYE